MLACKLFAVVSLGVTLLATIGCGGASGVCKPVGIAVSPPNASLLHTNTSPSDTQVFRAAAQPSGGAACSTTAFVNSNWTASDPSVRLLGSPSPEVSASCSAALANPVAITATAADGSGFTAQAALTCN